VARESTPFNAAPDTGRMGFRREGEPQDERPLLYYPYPFWEDETERMTYEDAVEANRIQPGEGAMTYMARISALVEGKYKRSAVHSMPRRGMSRRERDAQLMKLRSQAVLPSGTEDLA